MRAQFKKETSVINTAQVIAELCAIRNDLANCDVMLYVFKNKNKIISEQKMKFDDKK